MLGFKENDIAVIKLKKEVILNDNIQLACLPDSSIPNYPTQYGAFTYAVGWQLSSTSIESPKILQNLPMILLNGVSMCSVEYPANTNWNNQICSGINYTFKIFFTVHI